jgi:hypothetical protein
MGPRTSSVLLLLSCLSLICFFSLRADVGPKAVASIALLVGIPDLALACGYLYLASVRGRATPTKALASR